MRAFDQLRQTGVDTRRAAHELQIAARDVSETAQIGMVAFATIAAVALLALGIAVAVMVTR